MKKTLQLLFALIGLTLSPSNSAAQTSPWQFDASLYGVGAGMSGTTVVKGIPADLDIGFDQILENLEFGAMVRFRAQRDRWALFTDVIYMGLGASKNSVSADMNQSMVQLNVEYRTGPWFDAFAGIRYNNLNGEIQGTGRAGNFRSSSGTQDWFDPVVGGKTSVPIAKSLSLDVRGDLGGFGLGSDFTWQIEPLLNWRFSKCGSLQGGYRWLSTDYETGSGNTLFRYDMLTQGFQFGVTFHF